MKKLAQVVMVALSALAVVMVGYGLYQQSQLYPRINQELGYQQCVAQVQQAQAQQQAAQQQVTPQANVEVE